MPDSTPATGKSFTLPSGQEIYDRIMGSIEPELVTDNLQTLDAAYPNEDPSDRKARYERYGKAFAEYKTTYDAWLKNLKDAMKAYKKAVAEAVQQTNQVKENAVMQSLESQMLAA